MVLERERLELPGGDFLDEKTVNGCYHLELQVGNVPPAPLTRWETAFMSCTVTGKSVGGIEGNENAARTGYDKMMTVNPVTRAIKMVVGKHFASKRQTVAIPVQ